ncbi:class I SAM-dependent methyltransferase [Mariniblastus fucicola]|uniref:Methyltransferase domain-containing protein n=1 Tax=Mariniblastus fucicola TaxID=980251 RepID=A0A5B9PDR3_9BACT|nr:class I SAM-dependent methyltransferase [Mariniblastus fucicola]QEG23345.1 hypothetical protein MFFC18_32430 [Mariniblastus fucicola]
MSETLSIATANSKSPTQTLKEIIGAVVSTACRSRADELYRSPTSSPRGIRDKAIMAWLKRRSLHEGSSEFFERLHLDFWATDGGEEFADNCDHRFEDLFLKKQSEDFDALKKVWNEVGPKQIVEFGCSSGKLTNYLATNLDGVQSATGIEINRAQVESNRKSTSFDPRVRFECADASNWLNENALPETLFVTNGGVLEYFHRERLNEMLARIVEESKPAIFFASEPVAVDHDWANSKESVPFGEELSFSHNYTDLFESNGFAILHQRSVDFGQWTMVCTIAVAN